MDSASRDGCSWISQWFDYLFDVFVYFCSILLVPSSFGGQIWVCLSGPNKQMMHIDLLNGSEWWISHWENQLSPSKPDANLRLICTLSVHIKHTFEWAKIKAKRVSITRSKKHQQTMTSRSLETLPNLLEYFEHWHSIRQWFWLRRRSYLSSSCLWQPTCQWSLLSNLLVSRRLMGWGTVQLYPPGRSLAILTQSRGDKVTEGFNKGTFHLSSKHTTNIDIMDQQNSMSLLHWTSFNHLQSARPPNWHHPPRWLDPSSGDTRLRLAH